MRIPVFIATLLTLALFLPPQFADAAKKPKKSVASDRALAVAEKDRDSRRRVALVIGNGSYLSSPLKNPSNDARAMAATLRRLGFDVDEKTNLGYIAMNEAVEKFGKKLRTGGVGLFYYAGHGMQVNGSNYLIPTDAKIESESEVRYKALDAGLVLSKMEQAKSDVNIVVLDACRDNPFSRSFRNTGKGLASIDAPTGTIISYATAPGKTASDGEGSSNGLFTSELVKALETPGLRVEDVFKQVRKAVREKSSNAQIPWESSSLEGNFHFIAPSNMTDLQPSPVQPQPVYTPLAPQAAPRYEPPPRRQADTGGIEMVNVPGGCFRMGDTFGDGFDWEKPVHEVCVSDFSIGKYEVTVGQFRNFVDATGYRTEAEKGDGCFVYNGSSWIKSSSASWKSPGFDQGDNNPVACVSLNDAKEYISWLNRETSGSFRLPSEAEWEYAARSGGRSEKFSGGDNIDAVAWYSGNSGDKTHPVGQKRANGLGIYDMSGNVWEWVSDWYGEKYYSESPRNNPEGPSTGSYRVNRGGSWSSDPRIIRAAIRNWYDPGGRDYDLGFRLVLSAVR